MNLRFNKIKANYEKYEDELESYLFNVLPEEYKQVRVSFNVNITNMGFKDLNKDICWFWKTDLNGRNTKEKEEPEDDV